MNQRDFKELKYITVEEYNDIKYGFPYTIIKIKKHIDENTIIKPILEFTDPTFKNCTSLIDFMQEHDYFLGINAGIFHTKTNIPECMLIKDGNIIFDRNEEYIHVNPFDGKEKRKILSSIGIDKNGDLKIFKPRYKATQIIKKGIVDCVMGFGLIVKNYKGIKKIDKNVPHGSYKKKARQFIGQYENGDYFIITIHSPGATYAECRKLLTDLHLPNVYTLDGGSSTQTVVCDKLITPIYRDQTGRIIPSIIVFKTEKINNN